MEALGCKGCRSGQKQCSVRRQDLGGGQSTVCTGNPPAPHHPVPTPSPPGTTSSGLWRQGRRLFYEHCLGGKTSLNSLRLWNPRSQLCPRHPKGGTARFLYPAAYSQKRPERPLASALESPCTQKANMGGSPSQGSCVLGPSGLYPASHS